MKKLMVLLPFVIMSCQKNEKVTGSVLDIDSINSVDGNVSKADSIGDGLVVLNSENPKNNTKAFRVIAGDSIIKTINADMIPLTISEEFTTDEQKFVVKIKNFRGKNLTGKITPALSDMNIRFNQIKLADGTFDGPFGLEMSENVKEPGEVWLIIGKSLMASGKSQGKFIVEIK